MTDQKRTIAVSTPGGLAKQFRIQFRSNEKTGWRQSTVSTTFAQAQHLAENLQSKGLQVRVVHYRVPSAA